MNPGFTFSTGVSVSGPFLQPGVHTQTGTQAGKQSHIPYSQQRPSGPGPGPGQGPGSSVQGLGSMSQGSSQGQQPQSQPPSQQALQQSVQLQVQALSQQQQSPTKPVQQVGVGKSPPHHPGLQQVSPPNPTKDVWSYSFLLLMVHASHLQLLLLLSGPSSTCRSRISQLRCGTRPRLLCRRFLPCRCP